MKNHDYTETLRSMLEPERVFNVRGLCRLHGVPDITEHLQRIGWTEERRDGAVWCGPIPQSDEELSRLAEMVRKLEHRNTVEPKPQPTALLPTKITTVIRTMARGLDTWEGTDDERYRAMLKELIEAKSVPFTIMPWKYKLPGAVVPVCKSLNWVVRATGSKGTSWNGPAVNEEEEIAALAAFLKIRVGEYVAMLKEK